MSYHEDNGFVRVSCDLCLDELPFERDKRKADVAAEIRGWSVDPPMHFCDECECEEADS